MYLERLNTRQMAFIVFFSKNMNKTLQETLNITNVNCNVYTTTSVSDCCLLADITAMSNMVSDIHIVNWLKNIMVLVLKLIIQNSTIQQIENSNNNILR